MKRKLLYYLDDDNDDLFFFKTAVRELDQKVMLFSNGHDLLQALRHHEEKPDIIFLDLHMPILNGEEILSIIKHSMDFKHIPIVMLSSAYPKKLVSYLLDAGANHLMKKPNGNELKKALEVVLHMDFNQLKASA